MLAVGAGCIAGHVAGAVTVFVICGLDFPVACRCSAVLRFAANIDGKLACLHLPVGNGAVAAGGLAHLLHAFLPLLRGQASLRHGGVGASGSRSPHGLKSRDDIGGKLKSAHLRGDCGLPQTHFYGRWSSGLGTGGESGAHCKQKDWKPMQDHWNPPKGCRSRLNVSGILLRQMGTGPDLDFCPMKNPERATPRRLLRPGRYASEQNLLDRRPNTPAVPLGSMAYCRAGY